MGEDADYRLAGWEEPSYGVIRPATGASPFCCPSTP